MQTAKQSNIDYAVQAKSALAAVERLTADIEDRPRKTKMCREKWRDYGAALLAQRLLMPSNQKFGQWVKTNGLDQGLAAHHEVRANAMWMAERWDDIVASGHNVTQHYPTKIREACRDAGYEWAGETEHQKERKSKSVRTTAKRQRYSWQRVALSEGVDIACSRGNQDRFKGEWRAIDPDPDLLKAEKEPRFRQVIQNWLAQREPESVAATIATARETVNESARERFDKTVAKMRATLEGQYQAKLSELQSSFEQQVAKQVQERIAPELEAERQRARDMAERNRREMQNFIVRRDGIKQAMNRDEYRLLLNCLHPDRAPAERMTKFAQAFAIVKRLEDYIESFK